MMRFLYSYIALPAYHSGLRLASLFSEKARQWVAGRKSQWEFNETEGKKVAWFHCASLGEFEQGRPLIEAFRREFPQYCILLTFFSPSGYHLRKDYRGADHVHYLPLDTPANVNRFLDAWKPELAVFIKYEFWFNYISQLKRRNIPVIVVSAIFRPNQHFFRPWGKWFRKQLHNISWFFVQNKSSLELLKSHGIGNASVSGDTRFDRVYQIKENPKTFPFIEDFCKKSKVIIAGSTWPKDEDILLPLINQQNSDLKFILAPHEINNDHILDLKKRIDGQVLLFSEINGPIPSATRVVIINNIGILSHLYRYGSMAYVGGGFGRGIHNILEAATFGLPVLFGPGYHKFAEAVELVKAGGAFPVNNEGEFLQTVSKLLTDEKMLASAGNISGDYVEQNRGATPTIIQYLKTILGQ